MFGRGFRPFFGLAALEATLALPLWVAAMRGWLPLPQWIDPLAWHGHEMVFGFSAAAIAGFLLTAVPVWTGTPALAGAWLAGLSLLWLAGRVALALAGTLPALWVAGLDGAFLVVLAGALAPALLRRDQRRNLGVLVAVCGLAGLNLALHLRALGLATPDAAVLLRAGVFVVVVLLVVIGGRITPAFTQNALRRDGSDATVRPRPSLSAAAAAGAAVSAAAALLPGADGVGGAAALVAGVCILAALAGWQTRRTLHDPLLYGLHAGRAWLGVGLLASGLASFGVLPGTAALHVLTAGAIGTTILAVMMRVTLGHTGRPLAALPGSGAALWLVSGGAALRVLAGFTGPELAPALWTSAALLWSAGFAFFAWRYGPLLLQPRPDGVPG